MKQQLKQTIKILLLAFVIGLGVSYLHAWTSPSCTPPSCNTSAPLNVGSTGQSKAGWLWINGTDASNTPLSRSMTIQNGQVQIGTTTSSLSNLLNVAGSIGATSYCDTSGSNCATPASFQAGTSVYFTSPSDITTAYNDVKYFSSVMSKNNTSSVGTSTSWTLSELKSTFQEIASETRPIKGILVAYEDRLSCTSSTDTGKTYIMYNFPEQSQQGGSSYLDRTLWGEHSEILNGVGQGIYYTNTIPLIDISGDGVFQIFNQFQFANNSINAAGVVEMDGEYQVVGYII